MRIVHVSDCYPPRTGGIETQVRDLALAQAAAGHEVHVLTATLGEHGERGGAVERDGAVLVHRLGARVPFGLPVNPAAPPRVRALLAELRPDVVHVHAGVLSPFAYDGARVAVDAGLPVTVTWHCMLDGTVPAMRAVAGATRWGTAPIALSAVSAAAAERVAAVFDRPVGVLPNGMDLQRWHPPVQPPPAGGPLRCVATMRLAPRKRGPALIRVLADAVGQVGAHAIRLDVLGDGPVRAAMERQARRAGLGEVVRLHGRVDRDRLRGLYAQAHVFCAPAELEAFGIAALEARASGLVVVARRGTGIAEFVTDGVDGLLVADDAAMARALVRLVREPGLLDRLQGAARSTAPTQDWAGALAAAGEQYAAARAAVGVEGT